MLTIDRQKNPRGRKTLLLTQWRAPVPCGKKPGRFPSGMGKYNSSLTRVAPVLDRLYDRDPTGRQWLPTLLSVGDRKTRRADIPAQPRLMPDHPRTWGDAELALPPPMSLLRYLVQHLSPDEIKDSGASPLVLEKRRALARKDPQCVQEALEALARFGSAKPAWYVLEGHSHPDATLIMEEAVLVIEGKRTERTCTSQTQFMGTRSQLLRHMDAALQKFPHKRVFGLLLVEGDGGPEAILPSPHWQAESRAQLSPHTLQLSLPHRSPDERASLAQGVLGVATWQALCARLELPWPPYPYVPRSPIDQA